MPLTDNQKILDWVNEMREVLAPANVVWVDGSAEQLAELRYEALKKGELIKLNQEKLPGCYLGRSDPSDVARVESRTYICTRRREDAGNTNNWMDPEHMYVMLEDIYAGSMRDRTMYVLPYCMGHIGSPFAKYGIQVTDSVYVVLNMAIMTRVSGAIFDAIGADGEFVKGIHASAKLDMRRRYIAHFPEDNTIISVNSAYGGNALLGKKCFSLRIASYQGWREKWLAEHMLILGMENPRGEVHYLAAAFPSACGKTNLAMLIPPEYYRDKGYKIWCVGDDIAWLRIGEDGRLWAVNPENGFFGVAPGTSEKSNFNAMAATRRDTIFTNVALREDGTVWWEGMDKNPPDWALNWRGEPWTPDSWEKAAHPNSRFTAPAKNCPCLSPEFDNPRGVPISAIVFGGRRARTAPLVYQSRNWAHGVFIGSIMASETTAAASGEIGVVRRDPMAMLPFCGYNMGDYWAHWLEMGELIPNPPKIFNVNWFRQDANRNFLWPGFGENMRVLDWIMQRSFDMVEARETEIGFLPYAQDIHLDGLEGFGQADLEELLDVNTELWLQETEQIADFYAYIGSRVPKVLWGELEGLKLRLS